MLAVAGLWELSWSTPRVELDHWKYPIRDFGVEKMCMTPVSGIHIHPTTLNDHTFIVEEFEHFEDMITKLRSQATLVFIDADAEVSLPDFQHPESAAYVLGKTNWSPFLTHKTDADLAVSIPTVLNEGMLWAHQAVSIVLYDRMLKS